MMIAESMTFLAVLTASLIGSLHCAGMCGGFVSLYSSQSGNKGIPHLMYNFGRLLTYTILGILAGAAGKSVDIAGELVGLHRVAALLTGVFMICWGLLAWKRGDSFFHDDRKGGLWNFLQTPMKAVLSSGKARPVWRQALFVGLLTTLLPCGWLYAWVAVAASTASPVGGAVVMLAFWLGTLPIMLSIGVLVGSSSGWFYKVIPRLTPVLLILAGVFSLYSHLSMSYHHHHH